MAFASGRDSTAATRAADIIPPRQFLGPAQAILERESRQKTPVFQRAMLMELPFRRGDGRYDRSRSAVKTSVPSSGSNLASCGYRNRTTLDWHRCEFENGLGGMRDLGDCDRNGLHHRPSPPSRR